MTRIAPIAKGFADPSADAQSVFRAVLSAMSEPGREVECPVRIDGAPLSPVMAGVALTLLDYETQYFLGTALNDDAVKSFLTFHTGAPNVAAASAAAFALSHCMSQLPPLLDFNAGSPSYPDRSTTIIADVDGFSEGIPVILKGPGIADARVFHAKGLTETFWRDAIANASRFPLGVDCIFCGPHSLAALPRSTIISFPKTFA